MHGTNCGQTVRVSMALTADGVAAETSKAWDISRAYVVPVFLATDYWHLKCYKYTAEVQQTMY